MIAGFILSTFLGPLHGKNIQSWIEFWNSIFKKKKKKNVQINQDFIVYMLNRKTSCFIFYLYFLLFNI